MRRIVLLLCLAMITGCGPSMENDGSSGRQVGDRLGANQDAVIYRIEINDNEKTYWMATTFDVGGDGEQIEWPREDFQYTSHGYPWSLNDADIATQEAVGSGAANTWAIISNQGLGDYAASLCNTLEIHTDQGDLTDWFLPSMKELVELYEFTKSHYTNPDDRRGLYWSSTQSANPNSARYINFSDGLQSELLKNDRAMIRCIHKLK